MNTLVTGTPGSGKTTLVNDAASNDDSHFFDADFIPSLCEWREFKTGKILGPVVEHKDTNDNWYATYGWYWDTDVLKKFLADHSGAIICGSAENIADCYPLFNRIIIIRVTEPELLHNLASPGRNNPFGKTTKQRAGFMEWQDYLIKEATKFPVTFIDGNNRAQTYDQVTALTKN